MFSHDDETRELAVLLDQCSKGAVTGDWTVTTMQAGVSSQSGCYQDKNGSNLGDNGHNTAICEVIERMCSNADKPFNTAKIHWRKSRFPFGRGEVSLETYLDLEIVPRGPDDPCYQQAADARQKFWNGIGRMSDTPLVETKASNAYAQTKWFGPHRRVFFVERAPGSMLVTDGLSTPWAGIPDKENGVESEVALLLAPIVEGCNCDDPKILFWAEILAQIGDFIADDYQIVQAVEKYQAIVFCRLQEECLPYSRIVLSAAGYQIDDLPFGSATVLKATPVTETEILHDDPDEEWLASAARRAIRNRLDAH